METIGFVGVGQIGLPICELLLKSGYPVVGYRRTSLADFEMLGGSPAKSAAEVGARANVVFTCLPNDEALEEVVNGRDGLLKAARSGQIVVEFGSHPVPVKLAPREHISHAWLPWSEAAKMCFSWSNREAIEALPRRAVASEKSER